MFEYNICNQADEDLFRKQCRALEKYLPGLQLVAILDDVDGTKVQKYRNASGTVEVRNDLQVDALYVVSDFDLMPYFAKN